MDLWNMMEFCRDLAGDAGDAIMEVYATDFAVEYKADHSPLTKADMASNALILAGLKSRWPDIPILTEESGGDANWREAEYCFIVDPLDGTKEFVRKSGQFTVNIALAHRGRPVMGMIYAPALGDYYYGCEGKGAFHMREGAERPVHVTDKLDYLTVAMSRSHASAKEKALLEAHAAQIGQTIASGSSIKGCLVATGEADVYYRFGLTCMWDTAAMQAIVEQAGGVFRQMDNTEMRYDRENTLNEKGFYAVNRAENIWV